MTNRKLVVKSPVRSRDVIAGPATATVAVLPAFEAVSVNCARAEPRFSAASSMSPMILALMRVPFVVAGGHFAMRAIGRSYA